MRGVDKFYFPWLLLKWFDPRRKQCEVEVFADFLHSLGRLEPHDLVHFLLESSLVDQKSFILQRSPSSMKNNYLSVLKIFDFWYMRKKCEKCATVCFQFFEFWGMKNILWGECIYKFFKNFDFWDVKKECKKQKKSLLNQSEFSITVRLK